MAMEVNTLAYDMAASHFIDREQAKSQIEKCESQLKEWGSSGRDLAEAERYLRIARSFFRLGSFTKAFLFAVRARRIVKEKGIAD
jgi:hypothetical protein